MNYGQDYRTRMRGHNNDGRQQQTRDWTTGVMPPQEPVGDNMPMQQHGSHSLTDMSAVPDQNQNEPVTQPSSLDSTTVPPTNGVNPTQAQNLGHGTGMPPTEVPFTNGPQTHPPGYPVATMEGAQTQTPYANHGVMTGLRAAIHSFNDPSQQALMAHYTQLQGEVKQLKSSNTSLYNSYRNQEAIIANLNDKNYQAGVKIAELERRVANYKADFAAIQAWGENVQSENEKFRAEIVTMETGLGPKHDENHYRSKFEDLKYLVQREIVKYSRAHANQKISNEAQSLVLKQISQFGVNGQKSAEVLATGKYAISTLYSINRWRHALIRHVIALFLLAKVFEPFALAVSEEFSEGMKFVERDMITNESQFTNVLMIHQAIGRGTVKFVQERVNNYKVELVIQLTEILYNLLPQSPQSSLESVSKEIINRAVDMKLAMAEEHALYSCFTVATGEEYKGVMMDVDDEESSGRVFICSFPGLLRTIKKGGKLREIIVIKAMTILENDFDECMKDLSL